MTIFVDRYGGRLPSFLTMCRGQCEATGWIPAEPEWYRCPKCHGTGRVSYGRAVLRIPLWLWKGAKFIRHMWSADHHPDDWSLAKRVRVLLWCAYGADLQRRRP